MPAHANNLIAAVGIIKTEWVHSVLWVASHAVTIFECNLQVTHT